MAYVSDEDVARWNAMAALSHQLKFAAMAFRRTTEEFPATPVGGDYINPVPDDGDWSRHVPPGTDPVYISHRLFTSDGLDPEDAIWTLPAVFVRDGEQGDTGYTGSDGGSGSSGLNGTAGADGTDGVPGNHGVSITWLGEFPSHPIGTVENPLADGDAYKNTTDGISYVYQDGTWYTMAIDGSIGNRGSSLFTIDVTDATYITGTSVISWVGTLNAEHAGNVGRDIIENFSDDGYLRPNDKITLTDNATGRAGTRIYVGPSTNDYTGVLASNFSSLVTETIDGSLIVNGTVSADSMATDFISAGKILADFLEVDTAQIVTAAVETLSIDGNAVTANFITEQVGSQGVTTAFVTFLSTATYNLPEGTDVLITLYMEILTTNEHRVDIRMYANTVLEKETEVDLYVSGADLKGTLPITLTFIYTIPPGDTTLDVYFQCYGVQAVETIQNANVTITACKR